MRSLSAFLLVAISLIACSCSHKKATTTLQLTGDFILVKGGRFVNKTSKYYGKDTLVSDLYVGRYEVTQKEWTEVMGSNPSKFKGDSLPVETVTWYDCLNYCNKRSIKEGLKPYYTIDSLNKDPRNNNYLDSIRWTVTINPNTNGYRLPTATEWEYASSGGQLSRNYTYSGSNNIDEVAWYWKNSGDKYLTGYWTWPALQKNNNRTKRIGKKKPNELGIYDMAGNVREWCQDWQEGNGPEDMPGRIWKGGGWIGGDFCCASSFMAKYEASGKAPDQGLRVWRNR